MMTDGQNDRQNDGMTKNPKSNIAPIFMRSLLVTFPNCVYVKSKSSESIARELL